MRSFIKNLMTWILYLTSFRLLVKIFLNSEKKTPKPSVTVKLSTISFKIKQKSKTTKNKYNISHFSFYLYFFPIKSFFSYIWKLLKLKNHYKIVWQTIMRKIKCRHISQWNVGLLKTYTIWYTLKGKIWNL